MEFINKLRNKYGLKKLFLLPLYPFILLISMPFSLVMSLASCLSLCNGKWGDYIRFSAKKAFNSLYYWNQALWLHQYGRTGDADIYGAGSYPLANMWHLSLPSLFLFWRFGSVSVLMGMLGWFAGHLLWFDTGIDPEWIGIVLLLTIISPLYYFNLFVHQNYNALGWLFVPLGLYAWAGGHWVLASMAWVGASFGSFTVVVLAAALSVGAAFSMGSIYPIVTMAPACLKLLTHFWPLCVRGGLKESLMMVVRLVGISNKGAKYVHHLTMFKPERLYLLLLLLQFTVVMSLVGDTFPYMMLLVVIIYTVNSTIARFADETSMYMLALSVGVVTALTAQPYNMAVLFSFWLMVAPLPAVVCPGVNRLFSAPVYKPFRITSYFDSFQGFLAPVAPGEKVFMVLPDPQGDRNNLFDGQMSLLTFIMYAACRRGIHFMPNWWAVQKHNRLDSPTFWGATVPEAIENMRFWDADYLVVSQRDNEKLNEQWGQAGFVPLAEFSWRDLAGETPGNVPFAGAPPKWWLLKKPQAVAS